MIFFIAGYSEEAIDTRKNAGMNIVLRI